MVGDFRGLIVWRLADEIQTKTLKLIHASRWKNDFDLRDEAEKTASQIKRCIAEGFRRTGHDDFARFLEYSHSSLAELRSLYDDAYKQGYVTGEQLQPLVNLCYRLERGLRRFIESLRNKPAPPQWNYGRPPESRRAERKGIDRSTPKRPRPRSPNPPERSKPDRSPGAKRDHTNSQKRKGTDPANSK